MTVKSFASAVLAAVALGGTALAESGGPGTHFVPPKGTANVTADAAARAGAARKTVAFLGGSITEMNGFRPRVMKALWAKYGSLHYPYVHILADDLSDGTHKVRLRVVPASRGRGSTGAAVRIHRICVNSGVLAAPSGTSVEKGGSASCSKP